MKFLFLERGGENLPSVGAGGTSMVGPIGGQAPPSVVATSGSRRPIALPHHSTHPFPLSLPRIL